MWPYVGVLSLKKQTLLISHAFVTQINYKWVINAPTLFCFCLDFHALYSAFCMSNILCTCLRVSISSSVKWKVVFSFCKQINL